MQSLGLFGVVFDTGLSVTPLMGHLGCLASHWNVPVAECFLQVPPHLALSSAVHKAIPGGYVIHKESRCYIILITP